MRRPRVVFADDHALMVGALEKLIGNDYEVVGRFGDGRSLVAEAATLEPDVILLDVSMPLLNGLDAARLIKQKLPGVKLIFLTMHDAPELAAEAFRAGASGYVLKTSAPSELQAALGEVLRGQSYVTPRLARGLSGPAITQLPRGAGLTPRQREVLQLLAEGFSMKEVAVRLDVTPRTVAFHKYKMMEQLHLRSTAELITYAVKQHIV